jgi:hypothetical protein
MRRWWQTFTKSAAGLDKHFSKRSQFDLPALMNVLSEVDPHLMWEFGPAVRKQGHRLCITPESRAELRPMLNVLLDCAPKLDRWEFYPYRLQDTPETDRVAIDGRTKISRDGVTASAARGRGNRVDVRYFLPESSMVDGRAAQSFAFYTTERLLGEETLDTWIGGIAAFAETSPPQPGSMRMPLARLAPTVRSVIESITEQLPDFPRFAHQKPCDPQNPQGGVFKLPPPPERADYPVWSDLMFATSREVPLWQACHAKASFYSRRFSKHGEEFCYLKIDRSQNPDLATVAERAKIEDTLTHRLTEAQFGCAVGGGTGKVYSYIDLALTDPGKAVPVIREVLEQSKSNYRTWLLFYDRTLADEWVGATDETLAPPR